MLRAVRKAVNALFDAGRTILFSIMTEWFQG